MPDVLERLTAFVQRLAQGPVLQPTSVIVDSRRCLPPGSAGAEISKDRCYISLTINELFLANARLAWASYQPMVVFTTSFVQGNAIVTVPAVVGPSLLAWPGQELPQGLLLNDIGIVGPIPYRGGALTINVLLYRLKHSDHVLDVLRLVENVSKAIGPTADLGMISKIGSTLLDGLESLLGMGGTEPVMGQRFGISPVTPGH